MARLQTKPPRSSSYGGTSVHPPPKSMRVGARATSGGRAGALTREASQARAASDEIRRLHRMGAVAVLLQLPLGRPLPPGRDRRQAPLLAPGLEGEPPLLHPRGDRNPARPQPPPIGLRRHSPTQPPVVDAPPIRPADQHAARLDVPHLPLQPVRIPERPMRHSLLPYRMVGRSR